MVDCLPALLIVEGVQERYKSLLECLRNYDGGRLVREFEVIHLDCYDALRKWYADNAGRFVSIILQGVDYSGVTEIEKLVGYPELRYPVPKDFDAREFQGMVIYALMRETGLDQIVPVLFVSPHPETEQSRRYYQFMLYPAQGECHFIHFPEEPTDSTHVAERVDATALRPLDDARRSHWRSFHKMVIGRSRTMVFLAHEIERFGPGDSVVLLLGKPGVGKELVANALHRCSQRFVADDELRAFPTAVNIAALDRNLVEVELFGHARGAYTGSHGERPGVFEFGNGSTVFLDEIGEIGPEIQIKLLRTMENHRVKRLGSPSEIPVEIRIVAATNRTIDQLAASFRPDFYGRVVQQCLPIPSLEERWKGEAEDVIMADLREVFQFYVDEKNAGPRHPRQLEIDEGAVRFLHQLTVEFINGDNELLQGNIRTLRSILERSWERAQYDGSRQITVGHILSTVSVLRFMEKPADSSRPRRQTLEDVVGTLNMKAVEKRAIIEAMERCNGNHSQAAEILGIHRDTLRRKITESGL